MKSSRLIITIIMVLINSEIRAQEVRARAELDTNSALIGDQIYLHLTAEKPASGNVIFPFFKDTLSHGVEIIQVSSIDTAKNEGRAILNQHVLITVFDTGLFEIPSLRFIVNSAGIPDTINTLPVYFEVSPVKADSTIRDIKAIYKAPLSFRELTPYILLVIGIGLLTWLVMHYLKSRKGKDKLLTARDTSEPPDVVALRELEQLREEKPWLHNKVKYYHIRISEVLRDYIERRFKVPALEQTTEEILTSLKTSLCKTTDLNRLSSVLKLADLVKFAKVIPGEVENAAQIGMATEFVHETSRPEEVSITESEQDKVNNNSNRSS
jgi:hypothetical protein